MAVGRDARARTRRRSSCPAARAASTRPARRRSTRRCSRPGCPVLGICYGFQAMALALGGEVARTGLREYGGTTAVAVTPAARTASLLRGSPREQTVWMSHGDAVQAAPEGFKVLAASSGAPVAAFEDGDRAAVRRAVAPGGQALDVRPAGARRTSSTTAPGSRRTGRRATSSRSRSSAIRAQVGTGAGDLRAVRRRRLLRRRGARAAGRRRPAHVRVRRPRPAARRRGRAGGAATSSRRPASGSKVVDARDAVPRALAGLTDPEDQAQDHRPRVHPRVRGRGARGGGRGAEAEPTTARATRCGSSSRARSTPTSSSPAAARARPTSSSHHNVGGLPDDLQFELVEPLRTLFKDEVRAVGLELGLPEGIVWRQPFPGPGLGIRIVGEVTAERLETLRAADAIAREELTARRPGPRDLAVPGGAAGRRPVGRRAGRRAHLRPPGRAAAGVVRGRDDRRLDPPAARRAGADLDADHQRGAPRSTAWSST